MADQMAKAYEPKQCEKKWYPQWEKRGYFHSETENAKPYTIVIPPPNVTGILHLGHVLNNSLQDIMIRFEKMRGRNTCWVPGTDHAGIATQSKVEAFLRDNEGVTRHDLGREKFLERVWEWKEQYGGTIIRQLRTLGCACDWERERFTLDEGLSEAVLDVFIHLYNKGLVYKGSRIINWCPKSCTALSDEEVIYQTQKGHLWYINYPFADGKGHVTVATTRPETMLGDTAVAVNPNDERYKDHIGRKLHLPLTGREIEIIADEFVKPEFGTGAVKITPAHDPNDYEMGVRHNLDFINIFTDTATMNKNAGEDFVGMDRYECREAVVELLREEKLLEKIEEYEHEVGFSERGHVPVEPRISEQWFVRMKPLAEPALKAVADGKIKFHPERWVKTYNHWLENIKDWCISRQLWWGHRIPAWYCQSKDCKEIVVSKAEPGNCPSCGGGDFEQDPDVLDTWFSSWLWPFSVFNWPEENKDLSYYYPTNTLVTGPDIIFFWVARMIMSGLEFMGEVPFKDVYFTSIIRDDEGRKLSKSLGNSPDPLEVIDTYGADALRYTMIYLAPIGTDIRYSNEKCEIGRNFANKIWNAARFRQMQGALSQDWRDLDGLDIASLRPDDRWIIARTNKTVADITAALEKFDFHAYALQLYEFIWNEFCDWYVESAKSAFYSEDPARKAATLRVFDHVFSKILRLLHPVMPFVSEEIYHELGYITDADSIMLAEWPEADDYGISDQLVTLTEEKFELIRAGRNLRGTYNISMSKRIPYFIKPTTDEFNELITADIDSVRGLLNAESVEVDPNYEPDGMVPSGVSKFGNIYMPLKGVIDVEAELERLNKQKAELEKHLGGLAKKLSNENFLTRAPSNVVENEKKRQAELQAKLDQVLSLLDSLKEA